MHRDMAAKEEWRCLPLRSERSKIEGENWTAYLGNLGFHFPSSRVTISANLSITFCGGRLHPQWKAMGTLPFLFFLIWAKVTKFILPQFGQGKSAPLAMPNY